MESHTLRGITDQAVIRGNIIEPCKENSRISSWMPLNGSMVSVRNDSIACQVKKEPDVKITDVNMIVPDKVVEVTFADGTKEKSVCREPDTFSLESAVSICIAKKIMGGSSAYNNAVKRGMKVYAGRQKKEAAEKAEQERIEKKRAKRLAYKERRAAEKREEQIAVQAEAYLRAMKAMQNAAE